MKCKTCDYYNAELECCEYWAEFLAPDHEACDEHSTCDEYGDKEL